jgi:hypothetical protein
MALQRSFGQKGVFLDVSGLDGGDHWLHTLEKRVDASKAMVALIGNGWADVQDEKGNRRLENQNDFVRFELARAFSRSIPVLPVLIDGATMPDVGHLPQNLLPLQFTQAMLLRKVTLDDDAERIARRLKALIAQNRPRGVSRAVAASAVGAALLVGVAVGPFMLGLLGLPMPGVTRGEAQLRADLVVARNAERTAIANLEAARSSAASLDTQLRSQTKRATEAEQARDAALSASASAEAETKRLIVALKTTENARDKALAEAVAAMEAARVAEKVRSPSASAGSSKDRDYCYAVMADACWRAKDCHLDGGICVPDRR